MLWVLLFAGIALAGLVVVSCYAVWLAHKTSDVLAEVAVLSDRGGQLGELLGQIAPPERALTSQQPGLVVPGEVSRQSAELDVL